MPSLKKSSSIPRKLGVKGEDTILKDAIDFLFQIKGIQYIQKHPDFVTPSAEEFFSHVANLANEGLSSSPKKRTCLSNHFISFLCFLTPMFHDNHMCSSILSSLTIAVYALTLYTTTGTYLREAPATAPLNKALQTIDTTATVNSIHPSLNHFITVYMPYVPKQAIEKLVAVTEEFMRRTITRLPTHVKSHLPALDIQEIGKDICQGLDTVYNCSPFFLQWKAPVAVLLTRCGMEPCRSMCEEIANFVKSKSHMLTV
jgi:hypothetical protein